MIRPQPFFITGTASRMVWKAEERLSRISPRSRKDLLEILEERYGRRSTIVTSQLPVEAWHAVINDPTYADAILDRLVHKSFGKWDDERPASGPLLHWLVSRRQEWSERRERRPTDRWEPAARRADCHSGAKPSAGAWRMAWREFQIGFCIMSISSRQVTATPISMSDRWAESRPKHVAFIAEDEISDLSTISCRSRAYSTGSLL